LKHCLLHVRHNRLESMPAGTGQAGGGQTGIPFLLSHDWTPGRCDVIRVYVAICLFQYTAHLVNADGGGRQGSSHPIRTATRVGELS
jgi:hypothetical protein